ncbi:peptide-methionine (S)-S-oxide reductase MsrA [uncultured Helicobacter sp.]|uniref:peptide-methionine (S)-S-oxide reductase MsrA n=1 Tax=uncultured Helicobacter sp. TaxID=175537 RepID=UPI001C39EFDD|nr:peptide-methionine (S)-S-oxide reductase MsrA [Candidatus Helicobacter avicola]
MEIYLAGGCFWGLQGYFDLIEGVRKTQVGYANSSIPNPSYEQVCANLTNATEAVHIVYDPAILSLTHLLWRFFDVIDPTALNYQANDIGTQYRNGIYTKNPELLPSIRAFIAQHITPLYTREVVTEVMLLQNFFVAESYHQKYLAKNPYGYCHIDITKALKPLDSKYLH